MERKVRPAAVVGTFYASESGELERTVTALVAENRKSIDGNLRALVVPHAAHHSSGPVAASAYSVLPPRTVSRIVMLGPSHYVGFPGLAVPESDRLSTPLGEIRVDVDLLELALGLGCLRRSAMAHRREHSLEVQWPFLQVLLGSEVGVLPVLTGDNEPRFAQRLIEAVLDRDGSVLMIVSSDLSHYLTHEEATAVDRQTADQIVRLDADLAPASACGRIALCGLLAVAAKRRWRCSLLDMRTSGEIRGDRERVVGYGAFAFTE